MGEEAPPNIGSFSLHGCMPLVMYHLQGLGSFVDGPAMVEIDPGQRRGRFIGRQLGILYLFPSIDSSSPHHNPSFFGLACV